MWRKAFQQESEHQWIAISAFFVFVIVGAIFIKGTSHLPGVDLTENELGTEHRIIEAAYVDSDDYIVLSYNLGEYDLIRMINGNAENIFEEDSGFDESRISTLELTSNNSILIANGINDVLLIQDFSALLFETNHGNSEFAVIDIKQSTDAVHNYLMITYEDDMETSIRGLNSTGITSAKTPNNENVDWHKIEHISDDLWLLTGSYNQPADTGDESPAAPDLRPVWSTVLWSGGSTAPMIDKLHIGDYGEYHSIISLNQEKIIIAGSHETLLFEHSTGNIVDIDYSSVAAVSDKCGSAWLFNGKGSKSVLRFTDSSWEVESLPHSMPLLVDSVGYDGATIYLHGTDDSGTSKVMTFDTTAIGSIESGSGFINLSFIIISLIMFTLMAVNMFDKLKKSNSEKNHS
ncbi:MAG: hypothetical protein VX043_03420 [Candidatus Thermoplasmatota archaeon]|nr:hypothetical protein [Candidatus Thermoplasmatota archaeon]